MRSPQHRRRGWGLLAVWLAFAAPAAAQLNENCTVSILNRNAQVRPDGTWRIDNVPANFGIVRARATCVENGMTRFGESQPFRIQANLVTGFNAVIPLGVTTPIPSTLAVTAPTTTLTQAGQAVQLAVTGTYPSGQTANLTNASTGTTYLSSNPALATVGANGLVTALASGTVLVQATNEGTQGLLSFSITLTQDSDGDGIPDDVEIREGLNPNDPADALTDLDRDGLNNRDEIARGTGLRDPDSDDDTILDGEEVRPGADGFVTNPLLADTDSDGVRDALEISTGTDPTNRNSVNLSRALTRLEATPGSFSLIVNPFVGTATTQLTVLGRMSDNNTINLTSTARGTAYATSNVGVCNFGSPDGRVFAGSPGACTITVTSNGFSVTVPGSVRNFTPAAISQLQLPTTGYANNVDVAGNFAYVAGGVAGLWVVNTANLNAPALVATLDTPGNANDVRIVGTLAYVADGPSGLRIIDVSNPLQPAAVGAVDTPGDASDVVVVGTRAYVADGASGLVIVNVANPAAPAILGTVDTAGTARGVDVSGNLAVVADDFPSVGLRVVDVTTPASAALVGSVAMPGQLKDVRVNGSFAYVAAFTGGLQVVDFTTPAAPVIVGSLPSTFVARDVEVTSQFAIFAEQLFPNAVPFVDITTPSAPGFRGIIDFSPLSDYAGTGIAVNGPFVFMTGESFVVNQENGTSGNTRLFIGQYLPREDRAGVPPQVSFTSPTQGQTQVQGATITLRVNATDDVEVASVTFRVAGQDVFVDTTAPFEYELTLPTTGASLALAAVARDLADNAATASITVPLIPDPLTTVTGVVVNDQGQPVVGATVGTLGNRTSVTTAGGAFSFTGVPTVQGNIIVTASFAVGNDTATGSSAPTAPVPGGTTNVGTIRPVVAQFITAFGTLVTSCDDCFVQRTLPFSFPIGGQTYTTAFVGSNGYITFGSGDSTFSESVGRFNDRPRIAAFFDDLIGGGGVKVNDQLPGRFVVTYDRTAHFSFGGQNTLQIVLFQDGRIQFGYQGISALQTGTIVGVNPVASAPLDVVNFGSTPSFAIAAGRGAYEYFLGGNPFDLDNGFLVFTPQANGYNVRTILPTPINVEERLEVTGTPGTSTANETTEALAAAGQDAGLTTTAVAASTMANAEVEVRSSRNSRYRGQTNTDAQGRFTLRNVPPGGINVTVRRRGTVIGQGATVAPPSSANRSLNVTVTPPATSEKGAPR